VKRIRVKSETVKQIETASKRTVKQKSEFDGNTEQVISTGSTLLDLAISGGRVRGGGIPGGILVEIFGQSGSGKTVLLCEIAGAIQRQGGDIMFHDPEARLNKQFARMFDLDISTIEYTTPNTIPEVFSGVREWNPVNPKKINGVALIWKWITRMVIKWECDEQRNSVKNCVKLVAFSHKTIY